MAAEISSQLGEKAKLIEGDNGVFDVVADGTRIYSKHETGRFPTAKEVIAALKKR